MRVIGLVLTLVVLVNSQSPQQSGTVAFSLGQTAHLNFTKGEHVVYDKKVTNIGSTFNGQNEFVCSTPGVYEFSFYALTQLNGEIWMELMKNDQVVGSLYAYTGQDYADAGNVAILHLNAGDRVYIKSHDDYQVALYGTASEVYNTFSGELIRADATELDSINTYGTVAFSAALSKNVSLTAGGPIIYDTVLTDVTTGTGYDSTTGIFTAPIDGIYIFHFHSLSHSSQQSWLELYHKDQYVASTYGYTGGSYADAGNTVILNLKKGDTVQIKGRQGEDIQLYGNTDELYTTFNGALLSPTVAGGAAGPGVQDNVHQEVAFSAGLSRNFGTTNGDEIIFDRIFENIGLGYDPNTGKFTAKQPGIYVFFYHTLAQAGKETYVDLYHNYKYINSHYAHEPNYYGAGSNSAVLELARGDTVYLSIRDYDVNLYGAADEVYCTFSGYLLSPTVDYHPIVGK